MSEFKRSAFSNTIMPVAWYQFSRSKINMKNIVKMIDNVLPIWYYI